jgi:hypothetical protein
LFLPYGFNEPRLTIQLLVRVFNAYVLIKQEEKLFDSFINIFSKKEDIASDKFFLNNSTTIQMSENFEFNLYVKITFNGETVKYETLIY